MHVVTHVSLCVELYTNIIDTHNVWRENAGTLITPTARASPRSVGAPRDVTYIYA